MGQRSLSQPAEAGTTIPVRSTSMARRLVVRTRPRTALVLGAGGVLGAAWMTGALPAVQDVLPRPLRDVDLMLGTSAGSVLAAALRCGVSIEELIAFQRDEPVGRLAGAERIHGGPWPRPPHLRFGSPRLMASALATPHRVHPSVGASAWLPVGRENHDALRALVNRLHAQVTPPRAPAPHWVSRGRTWIVAVDYESGRRVVFGRESEPQVTLADAVVASCSVPGWFEPVVINGRRYVDGGVRSATSVGMLAQAGVDEVIVLAPMASVTIDHPRAPHKVVERRVRAMLTFALQREVRSLRAAGVKVTLVTPGPEDLAVMGVNLMDPRRSLAVLETSLRTSPQALAGVIAA
jgi:NTE family protein